nr:hypothetical protein [Tanacetum cinerariifolium]
MLCLEIRLSQRPLHSQQCDKSKTGLGYDTQGFDSQVEQHAPKPDLVFADEHVGSEYVTSLPDIEVSTYSKSCLKSYETLKEHYDNLTKDFNKSQFNLGAYKAGLEYVEARLLMYKKNKAVFEDYIKILKLDVMFRDKVNDKYISDEGYHAVPPPYTGNYMHPKPNLVFADERVGSESVTSLYGIAKSEVKTSESKLKTVSDPIIKKWVSDDEEEDVSQPKIEKKTAKPSFVKINSVKAKKHKKLLGKLLSKLSTIGERHTILEAIKETRITLCLKDEEII